MIWPILLWIGQFCITLLFLIVFYNTQIDKSESSKILWTESYQKQFSVFMEKNIYLIIFLNIILFIPLFLFVYKKLNKKKQYIRKNWLWPCFSLGVSSSLLFNILLFTIHKDKIVPTSFGMIISTGIVGPILEELIFRGIIYSKLSVNYTKKTTMILTTILFALMHTGIQIIYAFFMGVLFIYVLERYKSLYASIYVHCISNITVSICAFYLFQTSFHIQIFISLLCALTILYFIYAKKQNI